MATLFVDKPTCAQFDVQDNTTASHDKGYTIFASYDAIHNADLYFTEEECRQIFKNYDLLLAESQKNGVLKGAIAAMLPGGYYNLPAEQVYAISIQPIEARDIFAEQGELPPTPMTIEFPLAFTVLAPEIIDVKKFVRKYVW